MEFVLAYLYLNNTRDEFQMFSINESEIKQVYTSVYVHIYFKH